MRAYLGLGSNLGDRLGYLSDAVEALRSLDRALEVSAVYESSPVGGPVSQPEYLNVVVALSTALSPRELLDEAHRLEGNAGRVRTEMNGPRTLDVDVLLVGKLTVDEPDLVVPHPRMWIRAFVLAPLEDLAPHLVPDEWRESFGGAARIETDVRRLGNLLGS